MRYPVTVFVRSNGTWYGASATDQANSRLQIRTVKGHIAVTAGMWWPCQFGYRPFQEAIALAAVEAAEIERTGRPIRRGILSSAEFNERLRLGRLKRAKPTTISAIRAIVVDGEPLDTVAKRYAAGRPFASARRQLQRARNAFLAEKEMEI